ncbi:MAG TPA: PqqD family protein [Gemmatimonadaceae bacterium]|nr:PqqD family protein [Gemmatimonadaceae bacterium]
MTRYRIVSDALSASLSDGAVLLNLYTKRYFSLNETGSRIWSLLQLQPTEEEIVQALVREYDVEAPEATRAVHQLLEDLVAERLVETTSA